METFTANNIDQLEIEFETPLTPNVRRWSPASIALELGAVCMNFARIDRIPRYESGERENDAEHSFMLSIVATEIAHLHYPVLNTQLIGEYAKVHDLVELVTGDIATFQLTPEELALKEQREQVALARLVAALPPYTASLLHDYELQADKESRFVRMVDKLLPVVVDIIGQGERVMREDYAVQDIGLLKINHATLHSRIREKFGEFKQLTDAHRQLCDLFEAEF